MGNRAAIFAGGFLIVFGVSQLRSGSRNHRASDIALGIICILGGVALGVMMVASRNR